MGLFYDKDDFIVCPHCFYKIFSRNKSLEVCPNPKCLKSLKITPSEEPMPVEGADTFSGHILVKNIQAQKDKKGLKERTDNGIQEISVSTTTPSKLIPGVRVKKKSNIDLNEKIIVMPTNGQYFKNFGIVSDDRKNLYNKNDDYEYIQELSFNLDFIASSIMGGELDRLMLRSQASSAEEKVLYIKEEENIYFIYGIFPDKQGYWFLKEMSKALRDAKFGLNKKISEFNDLELANLKRKLEPRMKNILRNYIKMDDILTDKEIPPVDENLRFDYFGLSYKSTGLISNLLGKELDVKLDFEVAPDQELDIKESVVTSKIEAIAAFTSANIQVIPMYLSVKLGYQRYRYLLFELIRQDYYLYMIAEGNYNKYDPVKQMLVEMTFPFTENAFKGDLTPFMPLKNSIISFFQMRTF